VNTPEPVILFDGVCNFCNGAINFLIRQDRKGLFRFAPLQSAAAHSLLEQYQIPKKEFQSFVLIQSGQVYQKSTAALKVLNRLPWYWKALQVLWLIPKSLRDAIYDFIARNRYKWFGRKEECMVPTVEMRNRFLD
jgi:predicted DCC family thiol-disulfide oxidoreductase YuxK